MACTSASVTVELRKSSLSALLLDFDAFWLDFGGLIFLFYVFCNLGRLESFIMLMSFETGLVHSCSICHSFIKFCFFSEEKKIKRAKKVVLAVFYESIFAHHP